MRTGDRTLTDHRSCRLSRGASTPLDPQAQLTKRFRGDVRGEPRQLRHVDRPGRSSLHADTRRHRPGGIRIDRRAGCRVSGSSKGEEVRMPGWLWILLIVLIVLFLFGGFGYARR
jgi:hypothetical protein